MKLKHVERKHPDYNGETLQAYSDLFAGGSDFHKNISNYLLKNDVEAEAAYRRRCKSAHYVNYSAPIAGYFASLLFSSPMTFDSEPSATDSFWDDLKEDVDGLGTDLDSFFHRQLVEAMIKGRTFWRVNFPQAGAPAANLAEFQASGAGNAVLVDVPTESIINWRMVDDRFLWLIEHDCRKELITIGDDEPTITETWTEWTAEGPNRRWQAVYTKDTKPRPEDTIPEIEPPQTPLSGIPFASLKLPPELWLMNLIADSQLESFRQRNALSWAIQRSCYAMPILNLTDRRKPPAMGSGYFLTLGKDETASYLAPPAQSFDVVSGYVATLKDEIHRIAQQMARGVENNAAAIGRSGLSKQTDNSNTEIILKAYGRLMREAIERTLNLIAEGRGESTVWSVGGMDSFEVEDAGVIAESTLTVQKIGIPSQTFDREMYKRAALSFLADADEPTKQAIADEIEAAKEEELKPPPVINPLAPVAKAGDEAKNEGEAKPAAKQQEKSE